MSDFSAWLQKNKAVWTRVYDEVIAPDLEKEWKRRSEEHEAELKKKDEHKQILYAHVSNEVIKNARLLEENSRLKKLLQKHGEEVTSPSRQFDANTSDAPVPASEYHHITDKYNDVNKLYQDASAKIKYLERKSSIVMQKNKEMKESVRAWQEYCDRHVDRKKLKAEAKAKDDPSMLLVPVEAYDKRPYIPSSPGSITMKTPRSLVEQERLSPVPSDLGLSEKQTDSLGHSRCASPDKAPRSTDDIATALQPKAGGVPEQTNQESPPLPQDGAPRGSPSGAAAETTAFFGQPNTEKLGSSQTTEDDIAERDNNSSMPATAHVDDDDVPQFVSERSLKRKRKPSANSRVHTDQGSSDGTPAKPICVKEELYSSPPRDPAMYRLVRKDTVDLDELGANAILTPRRRLRRTHSIHSNATGTLRHQRSNSAPCYDPLAKMEPSGGDVHVSNTDISSHEEDTAEPRALSEPGDSMGHPPEALRPLDPNVRSNAPEEPLLKRVKREARQRDKYDFLAESGEVPPPMDENRTRLPPNFTRQQFNKKLKATKEVHTPTRNVHQTPKAVSGMPTPPPTTNRPAYTPSARQAPRKLQTYESRPDSRCKATIEPQPDRPIWTMTMGPPSGPTRKAPAPPLPTLQARLRDRSLSSLSIQDFKPNPRYNQGYTYAFSETVRKRGDRMCLPGCTNPSCCGSTFRALTMAASPLSPSQEDVLLSDYLGDAYDSFGLTQMSAEERKEIVLQARTRKMAKEHGKHRQAYEGRKTPPGFWRIDFPNTQEEEMDREKAGAMERGVVRERWMEAMRRGGRWVFRDE